MLRTILAVFGVYILVCGILGDYEIPESYTEADTAECSTTEQMDETVSESDYGMLADHGDAIIVMSPTTGE